MLVIGLCMSVNIRLVVAREAAMKSHRVRQRSCWRLRQVEQLTSFRRYDSLRYERYTLSLCLGRSGRALKDGHFAQVRFRLLLHHYGIDLAMRRMLVALARNQHERNMGLGQDSYIDVSTNALLAQLRVLTHHVGHARQALLHRHVIHGDGAVDARDRRAIR
jgi:hypothetical protein